ncbi:hypothetical protein [Aureibaculum luteum]|uniref:hypothetical protein n=1 Tax=Aureibaculum luteum TaxID=1548456 RepID=UPI000E48446A|nr:hypothetical protein [Aureibaculum luteum]
MTLYEFLLLNKQEQFNSIWNLGTFLDTVIEGSFKINVYAIDMFFVEVVYDAQSNKIIENRPFKEGYRLNKYSKNLNNYFMK